MGIVRASLLLTSKLFGLVFRFQLVTLLVRQVSLGRLLFLSISVITLFLLWESVGTVPRLSEVSTIIEIVLPCRDRVSSQQPHIYVHIIPAPAKKNDDKASTKMDDMCI